MPGGRGDADGALQASELLSLLMTKKNTAFLGQGLTSWDQRDVESCVRSSEVCCSMGEL